MFEGLSAFPLTPLREDAVDEPVFGSLVERLVGPGVDSIGVLGSTGSYAYLDRDERRRVVRAAVQAAGDVPVIAGIGAMRTSWVQQLAEDAQQAGAAGVLLAPISYQPLTEEDVFGLYEDVTRGLSVPLVVYDNPGTTRFTFTDDLYASIAALPWVSSLKIPGVPSDAHAARKRVEDLRRLLPSGTTIGVSGDAFGAVGLNAGCDAWYSVIAGVLPEVAVRITRVALEGGRAGDSKERASADSAAVGETKAEVAAAAESTRLQPLWDLFASHGSLRVTAAIAEILGLVRAPCLPRPIRGLGPAERAQVVDVIGRLQLEV